MKALKIIVAMIFIIIGASYLISPNVEVERSIEINAPIEKVFAQANDLKNWENWSPWFEKDPNMKIIYSSPTMGKDAFYSWESDNENVGLGKLRILESVENSSIKTELLFDGEDDPAFGGWKFEKTNNGTKVSWGFKADMGMNPVARYVALFLDGMVGPDFEKGLANMKKHCEQ